MNKIFFGDNISILKMIPDESVNLIYIDPPFNTGKKQTRKTIKTIKSDDGDRKGFQGNKYKTIELGTNEYRDSFNENHNVLIHKNKEDAYQEIAPYASVYFIEEFLRPRLNEAFRILKNNGSLYFHIDYREVHYCKLLLDSIFGRENFINEIIWAYDFGGRAKSRWPAKHDNILLYVKDKNNFVFHTDEIKTEEYMAPGLVGPEKAKNGKIPTDTWYWSYVGKKGMRESDTWWMTIVGTNSKERIGYPTQKPVRLLNRIIQASSFPNDVVMDFFAGSGTLGESCLLTGREFLLIDKNKQSLDVMAKRFNGIEKIEWINYDPSEIQKKAPKNLNLVNRIAVEDRNESQNFSEDIKKLIIISRDLEDTEDEKGDFWKNSPFEWIVRLPPRSKGKFAAEIIINWLAREDVIVTREKITNEEIIILNGTRIAVKYSSLWRDGEFYQFQQIKSDGPEYILCFGISPFAVHCWIIEKELAMTYGSIQHKGSEYWLQIYPNRNEDWLVGKGGSLTSAKERLLEIEKNGKSHN